MHTLYKNSLEALSTLSGSSIKVKSVEEFLSSFELTELSDAVRQEHLGSLLTNFGSDKNTHGYTQVYQPILDSLLNKKIGSCFITEIGLGTNNIDTPSNMGLAGRPGASLYGFTHFDSRIQSVGGDVDRRVLFQAERIQTKWVDQLNRESIAKFVMSIPNSDLLIDDGLHTYEANLNTLLEAKSSILEGGWIVIEDVNKSLESIRIWSLVEKLLSHEFKSSLVEMDLGYLYVLQKTMT